MKRLLLVDDDPDILEALVDVLSGQYEIAVARNGQEALDQLDVARFDAVVLDLMMPVMDGQTFLTRLQEHPHPPPVLLASASTDLDRRSQKLGAQAWISKPFSLSELERKLQLLLEPRPGGSGGGGAGNSGGAGGPFSRARSGKRRIELAQPA